ncbi:hypothetical protein [Apibacter sp. HY039]|uniref:hypothetical protein n=1 Tax=Apibacter sp. HY039 TaxID=2501476 RepID=UPI000FEB974B|nr:hypothetical protein [Apibacter sp. HY039]
MSDKKSLMGLFIAVILSIISFFVYKIFIEKKDSFLLDNPTEKSIDVFLNGDKYVLAPGQTLAVAVKDGRNTISSSTDKGSLILKDTFFNVKRTDRGLINPTLSEYYSFRRYYGHIKNIDSLYKIHKTVIDGDEFVGEIKRYNHLVIENFYYNVNQNFPKVINKVDSVESRVKLFRKNQFLDFYQTSFK